MKYPQGTKAVRNGYSSPVMSIIAEDLDGKAVCEWEEADGWRVVALPYEEITILKDYATTTTTANPTTTTANPTTTATRRAGWPGCTTGGVNCRMRNGGNVIKFEDQVALAKRNFDEGWVQGYDAAYEWGIHYGFLVGFCVGGCIASLVCFGICALIWYFGR